MKLTTIPLPGLPAMPLGYYLAALGVFRAVSIQYPETRAWWHEGEVFCLAAPFDKNGLRDYLCDTWSPIPLLRPWNPDPKLDWETFTLLIPKEQLADLNEKIAELEEEIAKREQQLRAQGGSRADVQRRIKDDVECRKLEHSILSLKKQFVDRANSAGGLPRWKSLFAGLRFSAAQVVASEIRKDFQKQLDTRKDELKERGGTRGEITRRINVDLECTRLKSDISRIKTEFNLPSLLLSAPPELMTSCWAQLALFEMEEKPRYNPILGKGGNDGRRDFAVMFQQALTMCLLDKNKVADSRSWLENALFGVPAELPEFTGGSWFASSIKQHNSGQSGFFSEGRISPWTYLLAVQGVLSFSGAASRRLGSKAKPEAVFPFIVSAPSPVEDAKRLNVDKKTEAEIWTPLWSNPASFQEIQWMLRKGRARVSNRAATAPAEMAQAALGAQVDRGILKFIRHSLDHTTSANTFEAVPAGEFGVGGDRSEAAAILAELASWVNRLPRDGTESKRYTGFRRRIEDAILAACQSPDEPARFLNVLQVAATIDSRIDRNKDLRAPPKVPVLPLSPRWFLFCHDEAPSPELVVAASIASLAGDKVWNEATNRGDRDPKTGVPPLRGNLYGVSLFQPWSRERNAWAAYLPSRHARAVWTGLNAARDFAAVLRRRCLDSDVARPLALDGKVVCPPQYLLALLNGSLDLANIAALVPAMSLINWDQMGQPYCTWKELGFPLPDWTDFGALDPAYLTLKLLFQSKNFPVDPGGARVFGDRECPPRAPQALARLIAGDLAGSLAVARSTLRACGVDMIEWLETKGAYPRTERIVSALLLPVTDTFLQRAARTIAVPQKIDHL